MEEHQVTIRPQLANAIGSIVAKNFVRSLLITIGASVVLWILSLLNVISELWWWLIGIFVVSMLFPIIWTIIVLSNTTYYFHKDRLTKEFNFITIRKTSVMYSQIVTVNTKLSVWDRMCNAGDIIVRTAEDNAPDLKLNFVPEPAAVEKRLYQMIEKEKKGRVGK